MKNKYHNIDNDLKLIGSNYLMNESMSKHTTFGIGGLVDILILPKDNSQIPTTPDCINFQKTTTRPTARFKSSDLGRSTTRKN